MKSSKAYQLASTEILSNPIVIETFVEPKLGYFPSENLSTMGDSGSASREFEVYSKNSEKYGTVYISMTKFEGEWSISAMVLDYEGEKTELLNEIKEYNQ